MAPVSPTNNPDSKKINEFGKGSANDKMATKKLTRRKETPIKAKEYDF
jgi:hypothetical protein